MRVASNLVVVEGDGEEGAAGGGGNGRGRQGDFPVDGVLVAGLVASDETAAVEGGVEAGYGEGVDGRDPLVVAADAVVAAAVEAAAVGVGSCAKLYEIILLGDGV